MSEVVNIGLIGCGGIARRHVQWFLDCPECRITVLCDTSQEAAEDKLQLLKKTRPSADANIVSNCAEAFARDDLDAVAILLPHNLHHKVTMAALAAGKHVLVEKPMAVSSAEAREMLDAATNHNRILALGYQRSFLPEYVYVRDMIARGEMGDLQFITAHLEQSWWKLVTQKAAALGWKSDPRQAGGGQLVDTGSHTLAALLDVTRLTPSEVYAMIDNCGLPMDVNTSMVLTFAEGPQATITIGGFGHSVTESIRVVGTEHSARIFFRTVKEQALEIDGESVDAPAVISRSTPNANFVDAILGKADVVTDGTLGLQVMQLTEAAYASARDHRPITIES